MAIGAQNDSRIGPNTPLILNVINNVGLITQAMAATTACFAARFQARAAKKPKTIVLRWGTITAGGTVQLGIETIDAATGKPNASRTLYDANATYDIAGATNLAAGIKTYTFASLPTSNVTVGTCYAVTLRTSVAGTTHTLYSHIANNLHSAYPAVVLTSTDGGTTWTELVGSIPGIVIIWDDDTCDEIGFTPYGGTITSGNIFSTTVAGQAITTNNANSICGVDTEARIVGTPDGDLTCTVYDSGGSAVSGATVTVDKDTLPGTTSRLCKFLFPSSVNFAAGTYRVIFSSPSSVNSSNCWRLNGVTFYHSAAVPASYRFCTASDGSADSTTQIAPVALLIDSQTAGGSGGMVVHPGMTGGLNG